jgi:hypothetical protein
LPPLPARSWQNSHGVSGSGESIATVARAMPWLPWHVAHSVNETILRSRACGWS